MVKEFKVTVRYGKDSAFAIVRTHKTKAQLLEQLQDVYSDADYVGVGRAE